MAFTQNPVATRVKTPNTALLQITNALGTAAQTLLTAGTSGAKLVGITITSTDTSARQVAIFLNNGSTAFLLGTANVAITSGFDAVTASVNFFNQATMSGALPIDNDGQPYIFIPVSNTVQAQTTTTVTSGKTVQVLGIYGDF